jgi:hypothetical protein
MKMTLAWIGSVSIACLKKLKVFQHHRSKGVHINEWENADINSIYSSRLNCVEYITPHEVG